MLSWAYNPLTLQVMRAAYGLRRPSIEMRVSENMPDDVWDAAIECVKSGGGSPAFYNEALYQEKSAEKFPHIPKEDLFRFNGGGCTETMLAGISRVGSLDAGINTALVLRQTITESLAECTTFGEFYDILMKNLDFAVCDNLKRLEKLYKSYLPHPMRTLLVDDCIENATDFNAGGARYNWSVINFAGIINVIDSLLAIKQLIFVNREYTAPKFIELLDSEDEDFFKRLKKCDFFGVDNAESDSLASDFPKQLFGLLDGKKPFFVECFLPASIQFTTYTNAGACVGPTPDGRKDKAPLCDSLAAIHGNDTKGPTAMVNSVTKLNLSKALGTPVLNVSLSPENIRRTLKPIVQAYFHQGGMQLQVTCVLRKDMIDALQNPEKHTNLIVRVGGYSEYFNNLTPEMKKTLIERTVQR